MKTPIKLRTLAAIVLAGILLILAGYGGYRVYQHNKNYLSGSEVRSLRYDNLTKYSYTFQQSKVVLSFEKPKSFIPQGAGAQGVTLLSAINKSNQNYPVAEISPASIGDLPKDYTDLIHPGTHDYQDLLNTWQDGVKSDYFQEVSITHTQAFRNAYITSRAWQQDITVVRKNEEPFTGKLIVTVSPYSFTYVMIVARNSVWTTDQHIWQKTLNSLQLQYK